MSGSHYAPEPSEGCGPLTVDDLLATVRDVPGTQCALTPPDALHPLTDIAALQMRLDNAVDALEVTALRVTRLEELVAAQREAIERHADALTVLQLRAGL